MAATLNSFLGNLDKIPEYIAECKRLNIEILKPSINKSFTKFTVNENKIRFGLGSVKNVGTAAVETIVQEREKNGEFKSFTDFAERIQGETVNKKCIESLIRAGAFDELGETRHTLMNSFESILDTIANQNKKSIEGQISMFDMPSGEESLEKHKYVINKVQEYEERELLDMEKEMLGIYISGHPLEKLQEKIKANTNINTLQMINMKEENDLSKDGKNVKYAGIITSVKKKYTKNNTIMAFVTVEDLYGSTEIIVFENCYNRASGVLLEDNIVLIEGRLSIREDDDVKIVANSIVDFENVIKATEKENTQEQKPKILTLNIQNATEKQKTRLRGAIRFFSGERNNIVVQIIDNEGIKPCGAIYLNKDILTEFEEILGKENVKI
jgi:DNA polymerase III, alpha subunit